MREARHGCIDKAPIQLIFSNLYTTLAPPKSPLATGNLGRIANK